MSVKKFEILSPEEMEKKNKTGYFACHSVNSVFQRWRFIVLLYDQFKKLGLELPGIRWSYNLCSGNMPGISASDKYVILLQNIENLQSPALEQAKEISRRPWWHFCGTVAVIKGIARDMGWLK